MRKGVLADLVTDSRNWLTLLKRVENAMGSNRPAYDALRKGLRSGAAL